MMLASFLTESPSGFKLTASHLLALTNNIVHGFGKLNVVYLKYQTFSPIKNLLLYCLGVGTEEALGNDAVLGTVLGLTANDRILDRGWQCLCFFAQLWFLLLAGYIGLECSENN